MKNYDLFFNDLTHLLELEACVYAVIAMIAMVLLIVKKRRKKMKITTRKLKIIFWCEFVGALIVTLAALHREGVYTINALSPDNLALALAGNFIAVIPVIFYLISSLEPKNPAKGKDSYHRDGMNR